MEGSEFYNETELDSGNTTILFVRAAVLSVIQLNSLN